MSEGANKSGLTIGNFLWFSLVGVTLLVIACALIPVARGPRAQGARANCKNNLRELFKLNIIYQDKFKNGPPREDTALRGSCHLKAFLYGPTVAGVRDEGTAVLKFPKLFLCPYDDIQVGSLPEMRALAPEDFCLYCSYVVADKNLGSPGGDHIIMADDAQDETGAVYLGSFPQDEFRGYRSSARSRSYEITFQILDFLNMADLLGLDPSGHSKSERAFYSHLEGGCNSFGDGSVDFGPGQGLEVPNGSVLRNMIAGNPGSKPDISCYH